MIIDPCGSLPPSDKNHFFFCNPSLKRAINIKKVKVLLTLCGPLPSYFLLSKAEASCTSPPSPHKLAKIALFYFDIENMATEETEDVIDDDEEEDSYSESEEPWDGPYRDPDDSYDPNWDTDADSDELELREVVTRALMEELEDEDDGLDSDDREFIDSMNPVPGNSIQSDCSCRSGQGLCI